MKKLMAVLLALLLMATLVSCAGKTDTGDKTGEGGAAGDVAQKNEITDALELLKKVWESYQDDEKFPAAGGDFSEENMSMDGPGKFSVEDTDNLDAILGLSAADVEKIDDAASLVHMMNANTFTAGAFRVAEGVDASALVQALKDNIMQRQWMCGFPDKLIIMTVDRYVISTFGNEEMMDAFKEKVSAAYSGVTVAVEEPLV